MLCRSKFSFPPFRVNLLSSDAILPSLKNPYKRRRKTTDGVPRSSPTQPPFPFLEEESDEAKSLPAFAAQWLDKNRLSLPTGHGWTMPLPLGIQQFDCFVTAGGKWPTRLACLKANRHRVSGQEDGKGPKGPKGPMPRLLLPLTILQRIETYLPREHRLREVCRDIGDPTDWARKTAFAAADDLILHLGWKSNQVSSASIEEAQGVIVRFCTRVLNYMPPLSAPEKMTLSASSSDTILVGTAEPLATIDDGDHDDPRGKGSSGDHGVVTRNLLLAQGPSLQLPICKSDWYEIVLLLKSTKQSPMLDDWSRKQLWSALFYSGVVYQLWPTTQQRLDILQGQSDPVAIYDLAYLILTHCSSDGGSNSNNSNNLPCPFDAVPMDQDLLVSTEKGTRLRMRLILRWIWRMYLRIANTSTRSADVWEDRWLDLLSRFWSRCYELTGSAYCLLITSLIPLPRRIRIDLAHEEDPVPPKLAKLLHFIRTNTPLSYPWHVLDKDCLVVEAMPTEEVCKIWQSLRERSLKRTARFLLYCGCFDSKEGLNLLLRPVLRAGRFMEPQLIMDLIAHRRETRTLFIQLFKCEPNHYVSVLRSRNWLLTRCNETERELSKVIPTLRGIRQQLMANPLPGLGATRQGHDADDDTDSSGNSTSESDNDN